MPNRNGKSKSSHRIAGGKGQSPPKPGHAAAHHCDIVVIGASAGGRTAICFALPAVLDMRSQWSRCLTTSRSRRSALCGQPCAHCRSVLTSPAEWKKGRAKIIWRKLPNSTRSWPAPPLPMPQYCDACYWRTGHRLRASGTTIWRNRRNAPRSSFLNRSPARLAGELFRQAPNPCL